MILKFNRFYLNIMKIIITIFWKLFGQIRIYKIFFNFLLKKNNVEVTFIALNVMKFVVIVVQVQQKMHAANFQIGNFNNNGFGLAQKDTGFN